MSGLVNGLQNRQRRFESATHLADIPGTSINKGFRELLVKKACLLHNIKKMSMKKSIIALIGLMSLFTFSACDDYETYGEKKEKERDAISQFIADSAFNIIPETQFHAQGDSTSIANREFVLLEKSGVYMQIVRRGCGDYIQDGETVNILCRFLESNIEDSTKFLYNHVYYVYDVDKMYVQRSGSTYTARYTEGKMYQAYGGSVPLGWLAPLPYIKIGRQVTENDELAKVRLIVPHSQGQSTASQYVYPYYYEITFQRER